jgi:hypothetical protein
MKNNWAGQKSVVATPVVVAISEQDRFWAWPQFSKPAGNPGRGPLSKDSFL